MPTRLYSVVFDTPDPARLGRWWSETIGWPVVFEAEDEVALAVSDDDEVVPSLVFVRVPEPKTVKNRVHLDLATQTEAEQQALIERLLSRGATRVDVGQGDVAWTVLADPDGNEFCVLEPRDEYSARGPLAAIVMDAANPAALAPYWVVATGWPVTAEFPEGVTLANPAGVLPDLDILAVAEPTTAKNRVCANRLTSWSRSSSRPKKSGASPSSKARRPLYGLGAIVPGTTGARPTAEAPSARRNAVSSEASSASAFSRMIWTGSARPLSWTDPRST